MQQLQIRTLQYWIGYGAGQGSTKPTKTIIGFEAISSSCHNNADNTAVGSNAGTALVDGDNNTLVGKDAGLSVTMETTTLS